MVYRRKERRRRYRVKMRIPLIIKSPQGDILTYTTNVSLLGAYVESNKRLEPSTKKQELILELTPSRQVRCSGVILRCEPKVKTTLLIRGIPSVKKTYCHLSIFFSNFYNNGEQRLADYLEDVLARQKKVLDKWMRKRKAKKKRAKSKALG